MMSDMKTTSETVYLKPELSHVVSKVLRSIYILPLHLVLQLTFKPSPPKLRKRFLVRGDRESSTVSVIDL